MAKFSFFFLLLTLFVYKDFKISQYHVVYALCTESSSNKISHCHISKTLKQASSLIICSLYLQIPVSGLTTPRSLSCLSTPPIEFKAILGVPPAPLGSTSSYESDPEAVSEK